MKANSSFLLGVCLIFLWSMGASSLHGQLSEGKIAITTAVPFLLIIPDARSGALGEAGVAMKDKGANSLFFNPALIAFVPNKAGFAVNYTPWLRSIVPDINHVYLPGYYNFGDKGGVAGVALTYFSLGDIQFTDAIGNNIGTFGANEFAVSLMYARKITDAFSAGVSLRYINSNLAAGGGTQSMPIDVGQSVAGDISIYNTKDFQIKKSLDMNFSWGLAVTNIGAKMNYSTMSAMRDFIPTNLRLGYTLSMNLDEHNTFSLHNDFNKLLVPTPKIVNGTRVDRDKDVMTGIFTSFGDAPGGFSEEMSEITTSLGLEYWYNLKPNQRFFAARLGYFYEDPLKGNRKFLTFGAGIKLNVFNLDFAYLVPLNQNHPLQNTLRFSLGLDFGTVK